MTFRVIEGGRSGKHLAALIKSYRFNFSNEKDLQDGIAAMFTENRIAFEREVELPVKQQPARTQNAIVETAAKIASVGRIDFKIGKVGIEIKVGGSFHDVAFQLQRYSSSDEIAELILVTTRSFHNLPLEIGGKKLHKVNLSFMAL